MLHRLVDGDKVFFLKNINGELNIYETTRFWLNESQTMVSDDPKMPLFNSLKNIYWNLRKNYVHISDDISQSKRYLTYALVNGEYKILYFGAGIYNKIVDETYYLNKSFNIVVQNKSGFPCYDNCYFLDERIEVSDEFLLTKTMELQDVDNCTMWTNKKQYDALMKFFKKYNVDIADLHN